MSEYSAEEVREWKGIAESSANLYTNMTGAHEPWTKLAGMLADLLERIKADAQPVARSEAVAGARIRHIDGAVVYDLVLTPAGELLPDGLHQFYTTPPAQSRAVSDVRAVVDRFLGWKLPDDFAPDAGITFTPSTFPHAWPIGTNLFTAAQAEQMFRYVLAAAPSPGESE